MSSKPKSILDYSSTDLNNSTAGQYIQDLLDQTNKPLVEKIKNKNYTIEDLEYSDNLKLFIFSAEQKFYESQNKSSKTWRHNIFIKFHKFFHFSHFCLAKLLSKTDLSFVQFCILKSILSLINKFPNCPEIFYFNSLISFSDKFGKDFIFVPEILLFQKFKKSNLTTNKKFEKSIEDLTEEKISVNHRQKLVIEELKKVFGNEMVSKYIEKIK